MFETQKESQPSQNRLSIDPLALLGAPDALRAHAFYNVFDLAESTIKSLAEKFYPKGTGYLIPPCSGDLIRGVECS